MLKPQFILVLRHQGNGMVQAICPGAVIYCLNRFWKKKKKMFEWNMKNNKCCAKKFVSVCPQAIVHHSARSAPIVPAGSIPPKQWHALLPAPSFITLFWQIKDCWLTSNNIYYNFLCPTYLSLHHSVQVMHMNLIVVSFKSDGRVHMEIDRIVFDESWGT